MSTIDHGVWASKVKDLARDKSEHGHWPIDVGKLGVPMANETTGGCSVGESIKGARSHRFLLNKESVRLSPYLACQLSVFYQWASEFIRVSHCSRKTMVASKDIRNYTSSCRSPTSSLRESSGVCSSVECSEILTMGCVS
jgi:hypothetical protein